MAWVLAATLAAPAAGAAQGAELARLLQREALTLGMLLQVVGVGQVGTDGADGSVGFSVGNARLRLAGQLDGGFGYLLQVNAVASPAILDAAASYRLGAGATLRAGAFKVPFSREFLTGAGAIDFVNRSQVVAALAPNRDIGVQLAGRPGGGTIEYAVGAFNGNRVTAAGNDNNALLYAARLSLWPRPTGWAASDQLEIAVNAAASRDAAARIGGGFVTAFQGDRTLFGFDARMQRGRWLAAAEVIAAWLDFTAGSSPQPVGWHTTAGYRLSDKAQVLGRWDALRPDGLGPDQDLLILGYNYWPTRATELQVNYVLALGSTLERNRVLVNLQVAF